VSPPQWEKERGISSSLVSTRAYRQKRGSTMIDTNEIKEIEEAVYEISDEVLERVADQQDSAYTFGACTGLSACPA
jgi:chorismate mutase